MGCDQPYIKIENQFLPPANDAARIALLTDFAVAMKAKMDLRGPKYDGKIYSLEQLMGHLQGEYDEAVEAYESADDSEVLEDLEKECVDVAIMAFLVREECIRLRKVKAQ